MAESGMRFPVGVRRYVLCFAAIGAFVVAFIAASAILQLASDALESRAASPNSLPRMVPAQFGLSVYRVLDRIAPASYVEVSLAQAELERGNLASAQRYALRLAGSPVRDELLARIALMRGEALLAREYFLAAPDPDAVTAAAEKLAVQDPAAAYSLERLLQARLAMTGTHPDAVAQTYWQMGQLANRQAWRQVPGSALQRTWLRRGLRDFEAAVRLAPFSERYLVAAANQADQLGGQARAEQLFGQAADIDPRSADALAGLGVIAWERGDRSAARAYLTRARAFDAHSLMVRALERDLR